MRGSLFEIFCTTIESLPPSAVIPLVQLERQMIEKDAVLKRPLAEDTRSVLNFCKCMEAIKRGDAVPSLPLPMRHLTRYRDIIQHLIDNEELPYQAKEQFEQNFSPIDHPSF